MKVFLILCSIIVSVVLFAGCGKEKSSPKAKPKGIAPTSGPMKTRKKAPRPVVKAKVPMFKGSLESSPWVIKELSTAGFEGLTMRVPKNAVIKKDPVNSTVGVIDNSDGFAIWLSKKKLDMAKATKAVQKSGLRPFKGFIAQKAEPPDL